MDLRKWEKWEWESGIVKKHDVYVCTYVCVCDDGYVLSEWMQFWFNALHSLHYTCSIAFIQTSNFIPFSAFRVENLTNLFKKLYHIAKKNEWTMFTFCCIPLHLASTQIYSQIYR